MNPLSATGRLLCFCAGLSLLSLQTTTTRAADPFPQISGSRTADGLPLLSFPYAGAQAYQVFGSLSPFGPFDAITDGIQSGPTFLVTNPGPRSFFRVSATPMSSNDVFAANVLNRLTYGPTPDDIEHMRSVGPQQFLEEQLRTENNPEDLDTQPAIVNAPPQTPTPTAWIRVSASGTASNTNMFLYLSGPGRVYVDDVRLVVGTTPDVGENLVVNGDFEEDLTNGWKIAPIFAGSVRVPSPTPDGLAPSGSNCLLMISTGVGTGNNAGFQQPFLTNPPGTVYTMSFSYLPIPNVGPTNIALTARASSNSVLNANLVAALPWAGPVPPTAPASVSPLYAKLSNAAPPLNNFTEPDAFVTLADLRSYHLLRAIQSKRQLYEILVQFFENHFTTEYRKVDEWFDLNFTRAITNAAVRSNLAIDLEWREHQRIRQALLNPDCTFYDLLKISAESPAMVIYLDTVLSTRTAANENYARELLELHTFGADNGYIQQDIVDLAKVWTGWRVAKHPVSDAADPHARPVSNVTNDFGVWVLHFTTNAHNYTSTKRLFTNSVIDPRFGPAFGGGQPYSLTISNNAFPGTNGMREGYLVLEHLARLPYTAEFLSVKLCRVFVHENFDFGVYDYNSSPLSPEVQLVKDCMTTWMSPGTDGRTGHIRSVLRTIFDSALFRGQSATRQNIKSPLEFALSAIRALRISETDTRSYITTTADTDGASLAAPLSRMGGMNLFNRAEPDGFSEFGAIWLNTANLDERWRFVQNLLMAPTYTLKNTDYGATRNVADPSRLIQARLPSASWDDPAAVVDFFLAILFPGEGTANLEPDRAAAIHFLNTNDRGEPSPFVLASQDGRVRGMVALLMCYPRFQEQ